MKAPVVPAPIAAAAFSLLSPYLPPGTRPEDLIARLAGPDEKARAATPRLLTVRETVARLRISRPTLYARVAEGVLPIRRVGSRVFVPESAVEAIESGAVIAGRPVRRVRNTESGAGR